jgi:hypothetical protein
VIDSSGFGTMKIDGIRYGGDLVILGQDILPGWRRREGHCLSWEDLQSEIKSFRPVAIVIGTGRFGRMRLDSAIRDRIEAEGLSLHAERTGRSTVTFNHLAGSGMRILGAFHLTC